MYEVKLSQYSGPLEKLLELIEEKKLEITTVSLGGVTGDFLSYIKNIEEHLHPKFLSDFVVVAARLMLIKSKVLLPGLELTTDEEKDIRDLEKRLKLYKEYKSAGLAFKNFFRPRPRSFSRPLLAQTEPFFYPDPRLSTNFLKIAMAKVIASLEVFLPKEERTVKRALVTIEEKMQELVARLAGTPTGSFDEISRGKAREEVIILFLAILHLIKQQKIHTSQAGQFDDIMIKTRLTA